MRWPAHSNLLRHMESEEAIAAFAALAQPTRLDVFRLLMEREPDGLPAGEVARQMVVPHNTMSTHLGKRDPICVARCVSRLGI